MITTEQAKQVSRELRNADSHIGNPELINIFYALINKGANTIDILIAKNERLSATNSALNNEIGLLDNTLESRDRIIEEIARLQEIESEWMRLSQEDGKAERAIERLTSALQERDAEIKRLTAMPLASEAVRAVVYGKMIDTQRKVLEQALEALNAQPIETRVMWKDGIVLDVPVAHSKLCKTAITAIQEILK